jgi:hypothetical protein
MDRVFERAFNQVHAQVNAMQAPPKEESKAGETGEVKDAIQSILLHWRNKEYFK